MAWYDDLWSGIKSVVGVGKDIVTTVAPFLPLVMKKGGNAAEFKNTSENRKKVVKLFQKLHPQHAAKVKAMKNGGFFENYFKEERDRPKEDSLEGMRRSMGAIQPFKRGRGRPRKTK